MKKLLTNSAMGKEMKTMSNSPLVNYTKISPNRTSPRNHVIDTITIHCVVGQCSVETIGKVFAPTSRRASSNYGVGYDGRIGMYCEEKDRSWCTSSSANDNRAITIEVASDTTHPYAVTDKAYNALIDLVTDICKRNNIKKLLWKADKSLIGQVDKQNMTVHRWFANKACPGEYLYSRHSDIANKVNARLNALNTPVVEKPSSKTIYRVQVGSFTSLFNAKKQEKKVKSKGFDARVVQVGKHFKVQVGAFSKKEYANATLKKLKLAGFDCSITTGKGNPVSTAPIKKSESEVAKEVIQGKWGNGAERKKRLTEAGYNYNTIQNLVNKMSK